MFQRACLSMVLASVAVGQSSLFSEVGYLGMNACPKGGCRSPLFDKGYFIQLKDYPQIPADGYDLWSPDGNLLYHVDILAPDGTPGHLREVAIDTDGAAIVPISYGGWGGNGRVKGGGLVAVDPAGRQIQFISTDRWLPAHACFGPDHSIWASGTQFEPVRNDDGDYDHASRNYQLVRKYSRDGKLLGEFLPRSSFPAGLPPAEGGLGGFGMRAARDRVGVLTYPGDLGNFPEWVELDLDGKEIGRWKLGPYMAADPDTHNATYQLGDLAFTADGSLYALPFVSHKRQIMIFDRLTSSWQPSTVGNPPAQSYLVGTDGNLLAFERRSDSISVIWVPPKQHR